MSVFLGKGTVLHKNVFGLIISVYSIGLPAHMQKNFTLIHIVPDITTNTSVIDTTTHELPNEYLNSCIAHSSTEMCVVPPEVILNLRSLSFQHILRVPW